MIPLGKQSSHAALLDLASRLAPQQGYNPTGLREVRLLRTEAVLRDIPVLYKPGAVFVLQGRKQGILDDEVLVYDEEHYLAVSVPVPFRMESVATTERPLLAIYVEFDMQLAAELASAAAGWGFSAGLKRARALVSSRMDACMEDVLLRLLSALCDPMETAIVGAGILRELHYRVLTGPQGDAMLNALEKDSASGRIVQSLVRLRDTYNAEISVPALAAEAAMSVPSYHAHFRALTGSSPMQYVKAIRLHEARLMLARGEKTIAQVALSVGYVSPAQFSRDFRRYFGRTASEEVKWVREHIGELATGPPA
ncbi:AraC family transcriptional regulator [Rhizobium sp. YS-1r]|uniref:AraC family transcriptional regulator n=1 Tax=Rhizobium sp. YS-1r TaxID=1532558 RepID=UPI00050EA8A3|nr:AraC family transcriptional regulator [Rhizobium sp. YS-1r]KGE02166.1 AraC family transcriptional regulator [Rhizobium sp. YS-1r]